MPTQEVTLCTRCGTVRHSVNTSRADSGLCRDCHMVEVQPPRRYFSDIDDETTCPSGHWLVDHNARITPNGDKICVACETQEQAA